MHYSLLPFKRGSPSISSWILTLSGFISSGCLCLHRFTLLALLILLLKIAGALCFAADSAVIHFPSGHFVMRSE
ncbi:hypothetical protein L6164_036590 [Bauhinia variegata]|uniref:Uncharacterized protein n=1 Tax=Bauhinia variegata TaxID=167791 RepID=A0ACB9KHI5_BAUVA|nr:hypothetical protein L6164_036590 [Bauhinia variegata]